MTKTGKKSQVWGSRLSAPPDELNVEFCAGRDVSFLPMADESLLEYDIWTNLAHSSMLLKVGILQKDEYKQLEEALHRLYDDFRQGIFHLDPAKEDVHINVEHYITDTREIAAGKRIHTGRSRNDQVATDMRLYMRDRIIEIAVNLVSLIRCILERAGRETDTLMPGFTHYQPAMLTTVGHWLTSWSQALMRDLAGLIQNLETLNFSPLGAAAAFGTSWPIDREYSAELLGFDGVDENSLDCVSTRGENETRIASTISILMNHLGTISQDIILLGTPYYGMLRVDDRFVTGSSIMPQKRNSDFAEIIRSKAAMSHGILMSLLGVQKGAMSGYNRDSQQTKYLFMDLIRECLDAPAILTGVISSLVFNREVMLEQCKRGFMNSADVADWLSQSFSLSFRDCYDVLSLAVKYSEDSGELTYDALQRSIKEIGLSVSIERDDIEFLNSPSSMLDKKQHVGAPAAEPVEGMIRSQSQRLEKLESELHRFSERVDRARNKCFGA